MRVLSGRRWSDGVADFPRTYEDLRIEVMAARPLERLSPANGLGISSKAIALVAPVHGAFSRWAGFHRRSDSRPSTWSSSRPPGAATCGSF